MMGILRNFITTAFIAMLVSLTGPAVGQIVEERGVIEILVNPDGSSEFTCYPLPCDAKCRDVPGEITLEPGQYLLVGGDCNFTEVTGENLDGAILVALELLGFGPQPGGPADQPVLDESILINTEPIPSRTILTRDLPISPNFPIPPPPPGPPFEPPGPPIEE